MEIFKDLPLPKRISPSPIQEAIFEVRFDSKFPETVLCGYFYSVISKIFNKSQIIELQTLQIPSDIRNNDPNLKFQPLYRALEKNYIVSFGSYSMVFSCVKPYSGWDDWSKSFLSIIRELSSDNCLKEIIINRISLRYIDNIAGNIFENTKTNFSISNFSLSSSNTYIHTEVQEGETLIILNMANNINQSNPTSLLSIFDIDCIMNCNTSFADFEEEIINKGHLDKLHKENKKYFFGLLKSDFLSKLNPEY